MSRIGKKIIVVPKDVRLSFNDGILTVEGPKGKLSRNIPYRLSLEIGDSQASVKRVSDIKTDKALHGLYRVLIVNMIKGVSEGYKKELEIVGVGFKAAVSGKTLTLNLGFSHPVNFPIPEGIKIETPKATQITISGIDKELVGEVASEIRAIYPPEPYKGKGIRYLGEQVKKKVGKAQATGAGKK